MDHFSFHVHDRRFKHQPIDPSIEVSGFHAEADCSVFGCSVLRKLEDGINGRMSFTHVLVCSEFFDPAQYLVLSVFETLLAVTTSV